MIRSLTTSVAARAFSRHPLRVAAVRLVLAVSSVAVLWGGGLQAQQLATAVAESVGMSTGRLEQLHRGMQALVDRGDVAGIVTLVAREGRIVDVHAVGYRDVASRTPMTEDTIFRIASMSKPITSVAVMMLYEDGKLLLTDQVSRYIPSFRSVRLLGDGGGTTGGGVQRGITVRDLLTHRSGLTYGFLNSGPVGDAYRAAGISDGLTVTSDTLAQTVDKLAAAPLVSQPGAAWNYSLSTDVLGRLVEVVSGQSFADFLSERLFRPLGMIDTSFEVADAKWSRLATAYAPNQAGGGIRPMQDPERFGNTVMSPNAYYRSPKQYFSGGAGLTSTIRDYVRFAQMLLQGGELGGVRILSPKSIELMTANHTSDTPPGNLVGAGAYFGLGFRVTTDLGAAQTLGSPGMYGWSGIYGTTFWVDPVEQLVAIAMVQRYPGSPVAAVFQPLVYQAITAESGHGDRHEHAAHSR